ncbi:MAG: hypothetical protein ACRDPD_13080 [Streptosporangiaceae bacterium]
MSAQHQLARTRAYRSFAGLARLFPQRRSLMLLAEHDGRIADGAHIGLRGTLSITLTPGARGQRLGRRLATALEGVATRLGLPAINAGSVTEDTRRFTSAAAARDGGR